MAIVQDGTRWFSVNFVPASGHGTRDVLWEMASVMQTAGWIGVQSGDGTTKTSGFPVSNPFLPSTNGWIQLRAPTGTLEVTIQRSSGEDYSARAYVCDVTFGMGGTASAPPTNADAIQIIGSSDSYDSGGWGWVSGSAANYRWMFYGAGPLAGVTELCWDGDGFVGHYAAGTCLRTPITDGFRFTVLRDGTGWPAGPILRAFAFDLSGNEA